MDFIFEYLIFINLNTIKIIMIPTEIITCPIGHVCIEFYLSEIGFHLPRAIGKPLMLIPADYA